MKHALPELPYAYDALEPYIDARTMEIHHTKHHQTYLNNLNAALEKHPEISGRPIQEILRNLSNTPQDIQVALRNHGGGHYNHTMFWTIMAPKVGGDPRGEIGKAISNAFGSFASFKEMFEKAANGRFGSGWAWLCRKQDSSLLVTSTANQDNPLSEGLVPLLGLDVWEHAYYLKYQSRRAEYVSNWWNVVNWAEVENLLKKASLEEATLKK